MRLTKNSIADACDRITLFSLFVIVFFLPVAKAVIESFVALAFLCFLIRKIILKEYIKKTPLDFAIYVYLIVCILSVFVSSNLGISARTFFAKTLENIVFFLIVTETLHSEKRIKLVLYVLFVSSLILGVDGIYQYFTRHDFLRHRPEFFRDRIYASFPTPNSLGCYLASVIPFLMAYPFAKTRFKIWHLNYFGLFILLFVCLLLTVSRGAWFAFLGAALFMSIWLRPLGVFFLILSLLIVVTQPLCHPFLKERLNNFFNFLDNSGADRKIIWQAAWKMFILKPWIGLGLGTFMFNFNKFVVDGYPYGVPYAHNCYLQMASESGIIGLVSFLSILVLFFYYGIKSLSKKGRAFSWYILLASQASILGYCIQMSVDTTFYSLDLGILFWFMLGLGVAALKNIKQEPIWLTQR